MKNSLKTGIYAIAAAGALAAGSFGVAVAASAAGVDAQGPAPEAVTVVPAPQAATPADVIPGTLREVGPVTVTGVDSGQTTTAVR